MKHGIKGGGHIKTSRPATETIVQALAGCMGKIISAYGSKLYAFAFDKSGVLSQECCG